MIRAQKKKLELEAVLPKKKGAELREATFEI